MFTLLLISCSSNKVTTPDNNIDKKQETNLSKEQQERSFINNWLWNFQNNNTFKNRK